jgi:endonuclease YncB( thermonuclease family)
VKYQAKVGIALIVLAAGAAPVAAQTVVDGDTIRLDGTTYRLYGIDAPEMDQTCGDWPAGVIATRALEMLIKGKTVVCEPRRIDHHGRTVAKCLADGEDLGRAMVKLGMAWAFTRYSLDYAEAEEKAKAKGLGVHAKVCELPWEWRERERQRR